MRSLFTHSLLAAALLFGLSGCTVEKTEEGRAPDVDVAVDPGEVPEYDVDPVDVDVTTEEKTVTVPDVDVDVTTEETTVTVPDVDINASNEDDPNNEE